MCNFGQHLLSSPGLSGTQGLGCCTRQVSVLAGRREEGAWGRASGSLPACPRGCRASGPLWSRCETWCMAPSQRCQPQEPLPAAMPGAQLGHCTHMAPGGSACPKRAGPQAACSSWLPGAPGAQGHCPRGHLALDNRRSQVMWNQGEVSPGDQGGHNRHAGDLDAGMLLPPRSF